MARTVAVDFDGVLHPYTAGWKGPTPEPEDPSPGAKAFLYELVERGFRVVVFSTRCESAEGMEGVLNWLVEHDLDRLIDDVTCAKPAAVAYVDDRAVPFRGDWDESMLGVLALADGRAHGAGVPAKTPLSGVTAKEAAANMKGASGKLGGSVDGSR